MRRLTRKARSLDAINFLLPDVHAALRKTANQEP
jgi:hypothetical protein